MRNKGCEVVFRIFVPLHMSADISCSLRLILTPAPYPSDEPWPSFSSRSSSNELQYWLIYSIASYASRSSSSIHAIRRICSLLALWNSVPSSDTILDVDEEEAIILILSFLLFV
jgi:hypothetical protein